MNPVTKAGLDGVALVAILGALMDKLPAISAGLAAVYYLILIYRSLTKDKNNGQ